MLSYPLLPRSAQLAAANQKVVLCAALIELGCIDEARAVISTIGSIDIGGCEAVAAALCNSLAPVVKQLHELAVPVSHASSSSAMDTDSDTSVPERIAQKLKSFVLPRLRLFGVHVGKDALLHSLLCRICAAASTSRCCLLLLTALPLPLPRHPLHHPRSPARAPHQRVSSGCTARQRSRRCR